MKPELGQRVMDNSVGYRIYNIDERHVSFRKNAYMKTYALEIFLRNWIFNSKDKTWYHMSDVIG